MMSALLEHDAVVRFDDALLAVRSPQNRERLIAFVTSAIDELDDGKYGHVLLAARRMTCIFALMRLNGLQLKEADRIVSDRFIELLPENIWGGEKILLLDDTRLTGKTTESKAAGAQRLVGKTGSVVTDVALDLSDPDDGPDSRPAGHLVEGKFHADDAIDLHNQFALAFGSNLLPFFTDFAISKEVPVTASMLGALLESKEWKTVDVTNSVLAGSGARAYSLFPQAQLMEAFKEHLGAASALVEIAKVRLFIDDQRGRMRLRMVPIVLTKDLPAAALSEWGNKSGVDISGRNEQVSQLAGLASMIYSKLLGDVFADLVEAQFGLVLEEDRGLTRLAMGEFADDLSRRAKLSDLAYAVGKALSGKWTNSAPLKLPGKSTASQSRYILIGDDAVQGSYDVLYGLNKEAEHRTSLREIAAQGKSSLAAASIAIDVLNDLGYSVPTFQVEDGLVSRAYRQGEASIPFDDLKRGMLGGRLAALAVTVELTESELAEDSADDFALLN
jgi:hypothetical protein